jgi:LmbE family N-acetylglucosaminyl deacetylase
MEPVNNQSNAKSPRVLMAVLAHPDDETFGTGGTLALYARQGVEVHLVCATRGEVGDVEPALLEKHGSVGVLREKELRCAAGLLGLAGVHFLDYRDSGMPGSPDNSHPKALVSAPLDEVAGRVARLIRQIKPQVVITFDPIGGYRHPDHIHIQQATVKAFDAAGDPSDLLDGLSPYCPQRLYFQTISRRFLRFAIRLLRLFGKDPHHFGNNGDIDLVSLAVEDFPIHAEIDFSSVAGIRAEAAACHASQGGVTMSRGFQGWLLNRFRSKEMYMRAYPAPVNGERRVRDLFMGVL